MIHRTSLAISRRVTLGCASLLLVLSASGATTESAPQVTPAVTVSGRHVLAEGITPHGKAVFFGISRGDTGYGGGVGVRVTKTVMADDDGDGRIDLDAGYDIPGRAVWAVVDFDNGQYALAAAPEFDIEERRLQPGALKNDESGGLAFVSDARARVALLVVRPGKGAWYNLGFLGGAGDARKDPLGEYLTLAFADGTSIAGERQDPAPRHLKNGDVLIGIDPGRLDIFTMAVGK